MTTIDDLVEPVESENKAEVDSPEVANVAELPVGKEEPVEVVESHDAETDEILDALLGRIGDVTDVTKYTKALIFGQPGAGKTVFCASTPKTLIVDIERGALSVNNHAEYRGNAKFMEFVSTFQLEKLIEYLKVDHPAFKDYETIVIDSYTALQAKDLDEIVSAEAAKDASRNKFLPQGTDYNINTKHMQKVASDLRDIDRNIIVTCHATEVKDETTGIILRRPALTPKLAQHMNGIFDIVGYMTADETRRTLQCHPTREIAAKTRLGSLPPVIENPDFQMILDAKKKSLEV